MPELQSNCNTTFKERIDFWKPNPWINSEKERKRLFHAFVYMIIHFMQDCVSKYVLRIKRLKSQQTLVYKKNLDCSYNSLLNKPSLLSLKNIHTRRMSKQNANKTYYTRTR